MAYYITNAIVQNDLALLVQHVLEIRVKLDVYNDDNIYIDSFEAGVISASLNISAESDIRRTCSIELVPDKSVGTIVEEDGLIWLNRNVVMYIGIMNQRNREYTWYKQGTFVIMDTSSTYDASTNTLSLNLSDWMARLDGSRNGTLSYLNYSYPSYQSYINSIWIQYAKIVGNKTAPLDVFNWWNQYDEYTTALTKAFKTFTLDDKKHRVGTELSQIQTDAYNYLVNYATYTDEQKTAFIEELKAFLLQEKAVTSINVGNVDSFNYQTVAWGTTYSVTDVVLSNKIRLAMDNCIGQLGYITNRTISDIGERKGMPNYYPQWNYKLYREDHPHWDDIPMDQEFDGETTVLNIVTALRDLYEDYECYFDTENVFCCNMIPDGSGEPTLLPNEFFQSILISENTTIDFTEVKNVTDVWGAVLEPDYYSKENNVTYSNNTYVISNDAYTDKYYNGDMVAFYAPVNNKTGDYININSFGKVQLYDENYEIPLLENQIEAGNTYVIKISKKRDTSKSTDVLYAYLQGAYQVHAMDVLTDGTTGYYKNKTTGTRITCEAYNELTTEQKKNYEQDYYKDSTTQELVPYYSERFFQLVYDCKDVNMTIIKDSPFTVQKLGVIMKYYNNEDIQAQSTAHETAIQENYRANRLTDKISIVTKLCPFADVNIKVQYQRSDCTEPYEYIVKSISHDLSGGTTTWSLVRYYPTYIETNKATNSKYYIEPSEE